MELNDGIVDLDEKRILKTTENIIKKLQRTEESEQAFTDELSEVLKRYGVTDFYLMAFKAGKSSSIGFNMALQSGRVHPLYIAKKTMDLFERLPDEVKDLIKKCLKGTLSR